MQATIDMDDGTGDDMYEESVAVLLEAQRRGLCAKGAPAEKAMAEQLERLSPPPPAPPPPDERCEPLENVIAVLYQEGLSAPPRPILSLSARNTR